MPKGCTYLARLRANGLRVRCLNCGAEQRHHFEVRLREKRSSCCSARLVPSWHTARLPDGRPMHPKLLARACALREQEKSRLRRSYEITV